MCGFVGVWSPTNNNQKELANKMALALSHRGPDDSGVWSDNDSGIALAHRRLSILDLSDAGHQPMQSTCQRYILVFNGEIYNHLEIRKKLKSNMWKGHADTETLVEAISQWGVEKTLKKLNGMFAFALWDKRLKKLILARDRVGEKPLYYGRCGDTFMFGSELKAFTKHSHWNPSVDRNSIALFLRHSYIPAPYSIYEGINKLQPAHFITISDYGKTAATPQCYWDLAEKAKTGIAGVIEDTDEMIDEVDHLIKDSVSKRMLSDVPLGAFLSGGVDSTMVVAQMQSISQRKIQTFTIGFEEQGFNEAKHAKLIAEHLGTDHTELYITPKDAISVIPSLPSIYDEPFSDSSQIPTYLVSKLAKSKVSVCLSGDGGDELFFGYQRYQTSSRLWNKLKYMPRPIKQGIASFLRKSSGKEISRLQYLLPKKYADAPLSDRISKIAELISHDNGDLLYKDIISHWKQPEKVVFGAVEPNTILDDYSINSTLNNLQERMMYKDILTYLPDDILTKVDRASMAVSLECRVPLLDHRLVELAWKIPMSRKYKDGNSKWILKKVLDRYVPRKIMDRPKMGFGVPIEHWLKDPLRDWGEDLLDEQRLRSQGLFDAALIRKMWNEHINGNRRWHYYLWDILMFQTWYDSVK